MNAPVDSPTIKPTSAMPCPPGHWFWGSALQFRKNPLIPLAMAAQEFGDAVRFRFIRFQAFFFNHPDAVKRIFVDNNKNYTKSRNYRLLKPFLGEGLLTSEGEFWRRQRRLVQPAFHRKRLAALADKMVDATGRLIDRWQTLAGLGNVVDVSTEMMRMTMAIATSTLFSYEIEGADARKVDDAMTVIQHETNRRVQSFLRIPLSIPTPRNRLYNKSVADMDEIVFAMISARRRDGGPSDDLLAMLLEACDADTGERMTDQQLRDESMTLFLAGHETTSNALTWTFYLLAQHPDVEAELRAELDRVLGGRTPTLEDIPKLHYTTLVIEEAMRLYPPAWIVERDSIDEDVVGGYRLPAGSFVMVAPWCLHRHPAFWDDPERFDPTRMEPDRLRKKPRTAYFPFGGGPRKCIGEAFAMMEMQLVLPAILQRFRMKLVAGFPIETLPQITLRPKHGLPMVLRAIA